MALGYGLTPDEIAGIAVGPTAFEGHDAAVLTAVDHVLNSQPADAATQAALGEADMLSVTMAAGFYETVTKVMHGVEPEAEHASVTGFETPAQARAAYAGDARSISVHGTVSDQTVAQRQMELVVSLADICARPARWHGAHDADDRATNAFFLISAASVAWVDAAAAHPRVHPVDVSIEAMAVFGAIEASRATGRLQIVILGSAPDVGHMALLQAARSQGATVLVLVPSLAPNMIGAKDVQDHSSDRLLHIAGAGVYDDVITMEDVAEMPRVAMRLRHLFTRRQGAIVQLCVPTNLLRRQCPPLPDVAAVDITQPAPSADTVARVAGLLLQPGGLRRSSSARALSPLARDSRNLSRIGTRCTSRPRPQPRSCRARSVSSVTAGMVTCPGVCASLTSAASWYLGRGSARPPAVETTTCFRRTATSSTSTSIRMSSPAVPSRPSDARSRSSHPTLESSSMRCTGLRHRASVAFQPVLQRGARSRHCRESVLVWSVRRGVT